MTLYNLALPFIFFFSIVGAFFTSRGRSWIRAHFDRQSIGERLGLKGMNPNAQLLIHAASVGELNLLVRLLQILRRSRPNLIIHVTCMTETGLDFALQHLLKPRLVAGVSLSPFDFNFCVNNFLRRMKALRVMAVVETELWPNWITTAYRQGVRVVWINARMSSKSKKWIFRWHDLAQKVFSSFAFMAFSNEESRETALTFGVSKNRTEVTGNMKWDMEVPPWLKDGEDQTMMLQKCAWQKGDFLWVAGSVREKEEQAIIDIFLSIHSRRSNVKLIIAPRHPERAANIRSLLDKKGVPYTLHSSIGVKPPVAGSPVLIVDALGALIPYYAAASAVFMGGSLFPGVGGHNFLEPAAFAKPVVMGPHLENFKEIADLFKKREAAAFVRNAQEVEQQIEAWIQDPQKRRATGLEALEVFNSFQGASLAVAKILESYLP